jgi:hypothetical protein
VALDAHHEDDDRRAPLGPALDDWRVLDVPYGIVLRTRMESPTVATGKRRP